MTGEEFQAYRESISFDQKSMGALLGVSWQCVDFWETNRRKIPIMAVKLIGLLQKFPQLVREF